MRAPPTISFTWSKTRLGTGSRTEDSDHKILSSPTPPGLLLTDAPLLACTGGRVKGKKGDRAVVIGGAEMGEIEREIEQLQGQGILM